MVRYEVTKQCRLDQIVVQHYGDLTKFDVVFDANPQLISVFVEVGDTVYLPPNTTVTSEESLW